MLVTGNGKRRRELDVGHYTYPFTVPLPSSLPCSLETKYCHVRFLARAEILRPWKFNHQTKLAFSVNTTLDLNTISDMLVTVLLRPLVSSFDIRMQEPQTSVSIRDVGWLRLGRKTVELEVEIDKGGTVSGDVLTLSAICQNHTHKKLVTSTVALIQVHP